MAKANFYHYDEATVQRRLEGSKGQRQTKVWSINRRRPGICRRKRGRAARTSSTKAWQIKGGSSKRNRESLNLKPGFVYAWRIRLRIKWRTLLETEHRLKGDNLKNHRRKILCRQNQRNSKWPQAQRWLPREANARSLLLEARPRACTNR